MGCVQTRVFQCADDEELLAFAKKQGQVTMFFFSYNCYVDGKLLIEMRNGVAGWADTPAAVAARTISRLRRSDKRVMKGS